MAEDDSAPSAPAETAAPAEQPSLVTAPHGGGDKAPETSGEYDRIGDVADTDDDMADGMPQHKARDYYRKINFIDLLVGITPDKLLNTIGFKAEEIAEGVFTDTTTAVNRNIKALFAGASDDEKGDPKKLPKIAKDGNDKGRGTA